MFNVSQKRLEEIGSDTWNGYNWSSIWWLLSF